MSMLKIALLGTPEVSHLDRRLAFPDRKALALLAYFAAEGGVHERQRLSRLFWPDSDASHGRTALRLTLHHLRNALEEGHKQEHETHLLVRHDALGLNVAADIELDLHELQAAWSLTHGLAARGEVEGEMRRSVIARLQRAVALYRGGFLEEFTLRDTSDFDTWVGLQRSYWYHRIEQVFDWLSQMQSAEGEIERAIETVERWHTFDPLNEDISLRLMQLHFSLGNRVAALKTYDAYRHFLMKELQAEVSPKMLAQAEFMRHATAPRSRPVPERIDPPLAPPRSLLEVPFVGRGTKLNRLIALFEKASGGQAQVVMIEGEAGIGKSRLAASFLDWARARGAEVIEGRAFKSYQHLAYQPLLDSLRVRLGQEQDLRELLGDTWLAELSRLFPDLRERYPDLPPSTMDEAFESSRFFEALARLGEAFAARTPLLIFVDDLQWTDKATLDVFQYLGRQWTKHATPVMLLLNRRVEGRVMDRWLIEWLDHLKRDVSLTRLELGPLTEKDILQIVRSVAGEELDPQMARSDSLALPTLAGGGSIERFGAWLFAETKGQPFFTRSVLEALLERGILAPHLIAGKGWALELPTTDALSEAAGLALPSDVRAMIQQRLDRLSPSARELLAAGAVLDHDFTFESLCQLASLSTQDGLFALDEAMESLLLQEAARQRPEMETTSYAFAHDKIREVVYAEAGSARRRIFHRRAIQVLEQAGTSPAELAYHAVASGSADLTLHWSMAAGDRAMAVFAVRDALAHYEQARQLVENGAVDMPAARLYHLFSQLGRAYQLRNDAGASQAAYQALLVAARRGHDSEMECLALNRQAVLEGEDLARTEHALALLQEALTVAERHYDQASLAETYWGLARVNYYALHMDVSLAYGRQAYTLAHELGKYELLVRVLNNQAYATKALGRWEEAATLAEEAHQLASQQGNRIMEADCLARVADARINFGQTQEGIAAARAAYTISLEIEHAWSQALSGYPLARGLVELGAYEEALSIALQSTEAARTLAFSILLVVNLVSLGFVYLALHLPKKALQVHREALQVAESISANRYISMSASLLCTDCVLLDDWAGASRYARQALATRDPHEVIFAEIPRWPETVALVRAGEIQLASEDLHFFDERFGSNRRCRVVLARAWAELAQARGENTQAQAYVREAIAGAEAIGLPGERWQAEAALGQLHLVCGEHEQARQAFARAASIIQQIAQSITDDEVRAHFLAAPQVRTVLTSE